jgi:hypothetical protein
VRPWQSKRSGLIDAAQNGHEAVVRLLIEHKAEIDAADTVPRMHLCRNSIPSTAFPPSPDQEAT